MTKLNAHACDVRTNEQAVKQHLSLKIALGNKMASRDYLVILHRVLRKTIHQDPARHLRYYLYCIHDEVCNGWSEQTIFWEDFESYLRVGNQASLKPWTTKSDVLNKIGYNYRSTAEG